ncbi:MAG: GreA/GreB family elongation factor [Candidatus Paceibacterota bacterium]
MQGKKFYLTKEGLAKIEKEFEELKKIREAKTKGEIPKVLQSEDIDSEYLSFHEDMEMLENRLREMERVLKNYEIIKPPKDGGGSVCLGSKVSLKDNSGKKLDFTIVGTIEANPFEGKISNESPVGKILLGKKAGETVSVPSSSLIYKVLKISYGEA